jgi:hypothetical protein
MWAPKANPRITLERLVMMQVVGKSDFDLAHTMSWHSCEPRAGCLCDVNSTANQIANVIELEHAWLKVADSFACICLAERSDRCAEASDQFHQYGLCRLVRFYRPTRPDVAESKAKGHEFPGRYGSWTSHQRICQQFTQSPTHTSSSSSLLSSESALHGARVLIFEDDVQFLQHRTKSDHLERVAEAIDQLDNRWDIFYLGHYPYLAAPIDLSRMLFRTYSCQTHAYILSRSGAAQIAAQDYADHLGTLDNWIAFRFRQYAVAPQIAVQSESPSDVILNQGCWVVDVMLPWSFRMLRKHTGWVELLAYVGLPALALLTVVATGTLLWKRPWVALLTLIVMAAALALIMFVVTRPTAQLQPSLAQFHSTLPGTKKTTPPTPQQEQENQQKQQKLSTPIKSLSIKARRRRPTRT